LVPAWTMMTRNAIFSARNPSHFLEVTALFCILLASGRGARTNTAFVNPQNPRNGLTFTSSFSGTSQHAGRVTVNEENLALPTGSGLYRKFSRHAWEKLQSSGLFVQEPVEEECASNTAPARGLPSGSVVQMEVQALRGSLPQVAYARYALLETLKAGNDANVTHHDGIQVLNLVIFPSTTTDLPVFGADFVSLPGGKHLLLLDAQPMTEDVHYEHYWSDWYQSNHISEIFPWGGDMPEAVQRYVSSKALWTRMASSEDNAGEKRNPVIIIQTDLMAAFQAHLEVYIQLLHDYTDLESKDNWSAEYLDYRLTNDPARPMLKSLYGEEWTERVLKTVLFPSP
jgi:hypothetical protein